jgi:hypothetical protein
MKTIQTLLLALLLVPSALWAQETEPTEVAVPVNQVPEHVMDTAREAKPGAFVTQALRQLKRDDEYYYRLYVSQVGRYRVIVVREDGELDRVFEAPSAPQPLNGT